MNGAPANGATDSVAQNCAHIPYRVTLPQVTPKVGDEFSRERYIESCVKLLLLSSRLTINKVV